MFVKFIHYIGATVHDVIGLVLGVLTDSVASKATELVLVYKVCCVDGIDVIIVVMDGGEANRTQGKMGDETEPLCFGIPQRTLWGSWGRDISRPAAGGADSWECDCQEYAYDETDVNRNCRQV